MTSRRTFQRFLGSTLGAGALGVLAQPASRSYRVSLLRPTPAPPTLDSVSAEVVLAKAFARMGYAEGHNFHLEHRYGNGDPLRLQALARELVQQRVDVIVAVTPSGVRAAMEATTSIPIVFFVNQDPIAAGFVQSLARPGSNVTGVLIAPEGTLGAKKLELLKAAIPSARRVTVLESGDPAIGRVQMPELEQAASKLGMDVPLITLRNGDYGDAFKRVVATRPDAVFVMADSYFMINRGPVIAQTLKHRLASMWEWREQVQDGGLMSYGTSLVSRWEQVASCVDRILKGARAGETPVDMPTNLGLALNLATAKTIGIDIPQALVLRADEVVR
ncbi:MAG: ABC transporter substrate-binding protein [Burkholderiales bacterium]